MFTTIPSLPLDQLLAWRARLISSVLSVSAVVEFEDRRIERRSVDELLASLAWLDGQIAGISGTGRGFPRVRVTATRKDL